MHDVSPHESEITEALGAGGVGAGIGTGDGTGDGVGVVGLFAPQAAMKTTAAIMNARLTVRLRRGTD